MDPQSEFLQAVGQQLPVPADVRGEILEELASHLADSVADLVAQGRDPKAAWAEAIRRLGDPATLARELTSAHRRPDRLLAAAGAGAWAAIRTAVPTALLAWTAIAVIAVIASVGLRLVGNLLGLQPSTGSDTDWNTAFGAVGLNVGALFAGAAAVRAAAERGWRARREVRLAVAVLGSAATAWFAWVAIEAPLNWVSVVVLALVPVSFALGTRLESLRPPSALVVLLGVVAGFLVAVGVGAVGASLGSHGSGYSWDERTVGYEMIAPWWQDPASGDPLDFNSASSGGFLTGVVTFTVQAASPDVIDRFHDYRFEAWRAQPPGDGWRLIPGQSAPFATAPAAAFGGSVTGTISFNRTPGVDWAGVALTAVGPDGRRYLLFASGPEPTQFRGSVWTWFTALGG